MPFEEILLGTAFLGSIVASAYDLKTTEVPDWVFYVMFGIGLPIVLLNSVTSQSLEPLIQSSLVGGVMLAFGFLMYRAGQWGGADAVLLAVMGFLIPNVPANFSPQILFSFPVSFVINLFAVGTVYMLAYAFVYALRNPEIFSKLLQDLRKSSKTLALATAALFGIFVFFGWYMSDLFSSKFSYQQIIQSSILPTVATLFLFLIYRFTVSVENFGFKKKIPVSKLRVGDMLMTTRQLVGIDEKQLRKIKQSGKKIIWIKEGVRFAPAFPMALLFTLYFGDVITLIRLAIL